MTATITAARLISLGACSPQVWKFRAMFGEEVEVSVEIAEAYALDFDWDWAARNLLPVPLLAEYERQTDTFWAEYRQQEAFWAESNRQRPPLWGECKRKTARLFAKLYVRSQEEWP